MRRFNLSTKFTLLLLSFFLIGIVITGLVLFNVMSSQVQANVAYRGQLLIETMNAVRAYTSAHINPLLEDEVASGVVFVPESVPAFSAREVFDSFRQGDEYRSYLYKEATLNPTNMRDRATDFERTMIEQFRADPSLDELSGFTTRSGEQVFYSMRPLAINSQACLVCHGDPVNAPVSLINTYGSENGFGWQMGEIVAAQTVYVPARDVLNEALQLSITTIAIYCAIFGGVILSVNFLLRRAVIRPAARIGELAELVGDDKLTPNSPAYVSISALSQRTDELGMTAQLIRRMADEIQQRLEQMRRDLELLNIQVDETRRNRAVEEISESDYFKSLKQRKDELRARRDQNQSANAPQSTPNEDNPK